MAIEFPCPHCSQLLRVGDDSAGKTAKCPKCEGLAKIPADPAAPASPIGSSSLGAPLPSSFGPPTPSPFGDVSPAKNPFSDGGAQTNPFGSQPNFGAAPSINPYASPQSAYQPPTPGGPITPQAVGIEQILNFSWQIWQQNLGLLIGVTFAAGVINNIVSYGFQFAQTMLEQNNEREMAIVVAVVSFLVTSTLQIFLGIGEKIVILKVCRRQPAEFSDLFSGAPLFLPALAVSILFGLAFVFGILLLVVPGVFVALIWWPTFSLVVDKKAGIIESFSIANAITKDNWGTVVLLWLLSFGIIILGCLALCIGLLFAAPLVATLWGAAYLMMSGQIPAQPNLNQPVQYGQPTAPKW
jgi:phage FluMu protein Com